MKKLLICCVAILPSISCVRQNTDKELPVNWNGYDRCMETGKITQPLRAGGHKYIGNVTYGIDQYANFYVTYDCSASGWTISETHMFAGNKTDFPVTKSGQPNISQFPYSVIHNPGVNNFTYCVPLELFPPYASPGFVVASHCVVQNPAGQVETAWAEGDYAFASGNAGWYDAFFYNPPLDQYPVLYCTVYESDSLVLYHLDVKSGMADLMLKEHIGKTAQANQGATFDIETGMFFFTKTHSAELWLNLLDVEYPSFCAGKLSGPSCGSTCHQGSYYYVNEALNTLNKVVFTNNWMIYGEILLDTIPGCVTVHDIAMSPAGDCIYMIGQYGEDSTELISWNLIDETFYSTSIKLNEECRIVFGSDNLLYSIAKSDNDGFNSEIFPIDIENIRLTPLTTNDHQ